MAWFKTALIFFAFSATCIAGPLTDALIKHGEMKISKNECEAIENELGQTIYATVYSNDNSPKNGKFSSYVDLVRDLNLGGVLPHYSFLDPERIYLSNQELLESAKTPLLIGVDYIVLSGSNRAPFQAGLGYGPGKMGRGSLDGKCFQEYMFLEAFLHKAVGINHALGPTIENSSKAENKFLENPAEEIARKSKLITNSFDELGIVTTMKHFPYTPDEYNLHSQIKDSKLSKEIVKKKIENFRLVAETVDFAMSTQLYNSSIDPNDMATFSKPWISLLRKNAGFDGILITDALFMINKYPENIKAMSLKLKDSTWAKNFDDQTVFSVRALLAGNDMIFLDGNANSIRETFAQLHLFACSANTEAEQFRNAVHTSYKKIIKFKQKNKANLLDLKPKQDKLLKEVLAFLSPVAYKGIDEFKTICNSEQFKLLKKRIQDLEYLSLPKRVKHRLPSTNLDIPMCTTPPDQLDSLLKANPRQNLSEDVFHDFN